MRRVMVGLLACVLGLGVVTTADAMPPYGYHHHYYGGGYRPYAAAVPSIGFNTSGFGLGISPYGVSAYVGRPAYAGYPNAYGGYGYQPNGYPGYGAAYAPAPVFASPRAFGYATPY
ncbi:MAG TPA: hypothetical protein VHV77_12000 [Pirellulales bacterium]|nr:hypothetical protein [Pirellulales bacterium]